MRKPWAMGIVAALVVFVPASCTIANDMKGEFGIGGNIGYSTMDTEGVNDYIDIWEERAEMLPASPEIEKEHMKGTMSYLGEIRYGITSNLMLTASGGFMSSSGKIHVTISPDSELGVTCDVSATFFGGGALYTLPIADERLNLSFGGELDYYMVKYEEKLFEDSYGDYWDVERRAEESRVGFHIGGGLDIFLSENIAVGFKVLYRVIRVPELETKKDEYGLSVEGNPLEVWADVDLSQTKRLRLDLGGVNAYLTKCFYFD